MNDRIRATYVFETPFDVETAAHAIAGEQSSGTFLKIAGETDELVARHGAHVEECIAIAEMPTPSLSGAQASPDACYTIGRATLSWPTENIGNSIPNLMATIAGNLFELSELSGIRLTDVALPKSFVESYPGPRQGVVGTRALTGVADRPLIGTIIKPNVGMTPDQTAAFVKELAEGGLDFIKDDELIANPPYSPLTDRVDAIMRVLNEFADRTGKRVMYASTSPAKSM